MIEDQATASRAALDASSSFVSVTSALAARDANAAQPAFYREGTLRRELAAAGDVPLYTAARDILPEVRDGRTRTWRIDAVEYAGVDLPTSELGRSIGHWNPDEQIEVFHVVSGCVQMVVREPHGDEPVLVRSAEGTLVTLAPGSWHCTFVERGPALIVNAYTAQPGENRGDKYVRGRPVELFVIRDGDRTGTIATGEPVRIRELLAPPAERYGIDSLEDLFARKATTEIERLVELAEAPFDERFAAGHAP